MIQNGKIKNKTKSVDDLEKDVRGYTSVNKRKQTLSYPNVRHLGFAVVGQNQFRGGWFYCSYWITPFD